MGNPFKKWTDPNAWKKEEKPPKQPAVPTYQGQQGGKNATPRPANVPPWKNRGNVVQSVVDAVKTADQMRTGKPGMQPQLPPWQKQKYQAPQNAQQVMNIVDRQNGASQKSAQYPSWFYSGRGSNVPQLWDKSQHFAPENYAPLTAGAAPATTKTFESYYGDRPFSYFNDRMAADEALSNLPKSGDYVKAPPKQWPPSWWPVAKAELPLIEDTTPTTVAPSNGGGDDGWPGYGGGGGGGYGGGYEQKMPPWYYGLSTWRI